jgi:hypothetical protein
MTQCSNTVITDSPGESTIEAEITSISSPEDGVIEAEYEVRNVVVTEPGEVLGIFVQREFGDATELNMEPGSTFTDTDRRTGLSGTATYDIDVHGNRSEWEWPGQVVPSETIQTEAPDESTVTAILEDVEVNSGDEIDVQMRVQNEIQSGSGQEIVGTAGIEVDGQREYDFRFGLQPGDSEQQFASIAGLDSGGREVCAVIFDQTKF